MVIPVDLKTLTRCGGNALMVIWRLTINLGYGYSYVLATHNRADVDYWYALLVNFSLPLVDSLGCCDTELLFNGVFNLSTYGLQLLQMTMFHMNDLGKDFIPCNSLLW